MVPLSPSYGISPAMGLSSSAKPQSIFLGFASHIAKAVCSGTFSAVYADGKSTDIAATVNIKEMLMILLFTAITLL